MTADAAGLRRLLLLVCAVVIADTALFATITPLLPDYVDDFGLDKLQAGILAGAYPAGTLLGSLPGGVMAVRLGVRPTVLLGLTCLIAASIAFAFAHDIVILDAARFVQGWGGAATWAGALAWLVGAAPSDRRGTLIGTALGAAIAGSLLGPVFGGVTHVTGREAAFLGVAVIAASFGVWAMSTPTAPPERTSRLRDVPRALRDGRVAAGMWMIALPGLLFGAIDVLAPLRLDDLGASTTGIAAAFLVAAALEGGVSPIAGRLSDRYGRRAPLLVALPAATVVLLLLALPGRLALFIAVLLVVVPVIGIIWTPATALLSDGADAVGLDQGYAFALLNLGWACGQVSGALGGPALAQATSDGLAYVALAAMCAATLGVLGLSHRGHTAQAAPG